MMLDIFIDNFASQAVSHRPGKISVFPHFPRPKFFLQTRELAEQFPRAYTFYCSYHLAYRIPWRKRYQHVNMIYGYFHFLDFIPILFADLPNQLFRSFPYLRPRKYLLPVLRAPYQMIYRVIDRVTRSLQSHTCFYTISRKGLCGLGRLSRLPNNPPVKACIHPRGKPRGISAKLFVKNGNADGFRQEKVGTLSRAQVVFKYHQVKRSGSC